MSQSIRPFPSFPMTSQVRAEPALSATAVELCEAYIFPPISISDCDYDYEHEYEHGFLHSGFVIPSSFVIRASSFSHHSLINSRRSPSLPLCSCLTRAQLLITLLRNS